MGPVRVSASLSGIAMSTPEKVRASRSRKESTRLVAGEVRQTSGEFSLTRELGILLTDVAATNSTCFKDLRRRIVSVPTVAWESHGRQRPSRVGRCSESTRYFFFRDTRHTYGS